MEAILYQKLKNNLVKCLACAHYCTISDGHTGICGVRKNIHGTLELLVYGQAAAVQIDPLEKKPFFHFLPGERVFSFGTIGCNFSCAFCQNWSISQAVRLAKSQLKENLNLGHFASFGQKLFPEDIVKYCEQEKIPAIAYTYNEPTIFFEYAYQTMKLAKEKGIKNVFVSNGYFSKEALEKVNGLLDACNIDLKSMNPNFYQRTCQARLEPVLENIKRVVEKNIWLEVTTLLIPTLNDSPEEIFQAANFLKKINPEIPWHLTAFHPDYQLDNLPPTPDATLEEALKIAKQVGLKYVYLGNIWEAKHQSTYCPNCHTLLIKRMGYDVSLTKNFVNGVCQKCYYKIKGVWS